METCRQEDINLDFCSEDHFQSTEPAKSTQSGKSTQPAKSTQSAKSTQPAKSRKSAKSTQSAHVCLDTEIHFRSILFCFKKIEKFDIVSLSHLSLDFSLSLSLSLSLYFSLFLFLFLSLSLSLSLSLFFMRSAAKIERGSGTERARLGTLKALAQNVKD